MRKVWTDERMDDLARHVDAGFHESREDLRSFRVEVKTDLVALRAEIDARFERIDAKIDAKFDVLDGRLFSLQRLTIGTLLTVVLGFLLDRL